MPDKEPKIEKQETDADIIASLISVKNAADGKTELISNQGQALDGYSELANYRYIIQKAMDRNA